MLGAVVAAGKPPEHELDVVVDPDAVYAVSDPEARAAGAVLHLDGETGSQGVTTPERSGELVVVVDCAADGETLVRIRFGCHHEVLVRSSGRGARLSRERERELVLASAAGDRTACANLVESFVPAIAGMARLYRGVANVNREELIQSGVVGLLKAVKRFDPELGTPFWAYASWWVRQGMQTLVAELGRPAVLSDRALRGLARVRSARAEFLRTHQREPTSDELILATGLPREQVAQLLVVEHVPRGLEEPVSGDDGAATTVGELLSDPDAETAYDKVIEQLEIEHVRDLTAMLTSREREILFDHYGLGRPPRTLREIGERMGVSAERVRQIEEVALRKLREAVLAQQGRPWAGP
jgi:RNA polymerase primary sigma factor